MTDRQNKMEAVNLARELRLPPEVIIAVEQVGSRLSWEQFAVDMIDLTDAEKAESAQKKLAKELQAYEGDSGMAQLTVMLAAAAYTRERYIEWGLGDNLFLDTMACFGRFIGETKGRTGQYYFDRSFWVWRQLCGRLFRLGVLEYEYCPWGIGKTPPALLEKAPVICVHIPSGAGLSTTALKDSYQELKWFQAQKGNRIWAQMPQATVCSTWLLSPTLKKLLPETSSIRRFASTYDVYGIDTEDTEFYEWLFDGCRELSKVPLKTKLQHEAKEFLADGGKIGSAVGVLNSTWQNW